MTLRDRDANGAAAEVARRGAVTVGHLVELGVLDTPENRDRFIATIPLGRLSQASDIAAAALFLASDEARFVTGTEIIVDGGMVARCD